MAAADVTERLDQIFQPWNRSDAPGVVVGVAREGRLLYRRGFGMASLEARAALAPTTRMRIGSTSKHFTCLLLLLLAEEGHISLDAPVGKYIPELGPKNGAPTLRQLMLHRGGGRDYVDLSVLTHGWNSQPAGAPLRVQSRQQDWNFAPGETMIYNNGGYHLLSIAAERAGGKSFETLLQERLFAPINMSATASVPSDHVITPGMATLHMPGPDGTWMRGLFPSDEVKGEGAIVSTVDDMLRWMSHLRTRDRFGISETWNELLTPTPGSDCKLGAYALGLQLADYRGLPTVSHSGGVLGGSCEMITVTSADLDVVIMANGAPNANPSALALQVIDVVLEDLLSPKKAPILAEEFRDGLGVWWSAQTGMVYELVDADGELKLQMCSQPFGIELLRTADGRVILPESSVGELEFCLDREDKDSLDIRFDRTTDRYRRISAAKMNGDIFAEDIKGRYFSADADATATISRQNGNLAIEISDSSGETSGLLSPLGNDVAGVGPLAMVYWAAITFARKAGRVTGFKLNAMRTRGLSFERIETSVARKA